MDKQTEKNYHNKTYNFIRCFKFRVFHFNTFNVHNYKIFDSEAIKAQIETAKGGIAGIMLPYFRDTIVKHSPTRITIFAEIAEKKDFQFTIESPLIR